MAVIGMTGELSAPYRTARRFAGRLKEIAQRPRRDAHVDPKFKPPESQKS